MKLAITKKYFFKFCASDGPKNGVKVTIFDKKILFFGEIYEEINKLRK